MSVRMMARVWDSGIEDRSELLVMLALADFCDDDGKCWPSMARIAEKARTTERGAQKIVRRLEACGWLSVDTGNGRGGCNRYTLNPERETPNTVPPNAVHPEHGDTKPRTGVQKTPNGGSPEPSRTIKNRHSKDAREVMDALCTVLSLETATAFADHRKAKRAKLTPRAAQLIAKKLAGHPDPDSVAENSIANGWTGVFPESTNTKARSQGDDRMAAAARAAQRYTSKRGMDGGPRPDPSEPLLPAGSTLRVIGSGNA